MDAAFAEQDDVLSSVESELASLTVPDEEEAPPDSGRVDRETRVEAGEVPAVVIEELRRLREATKVVLRATKALYTHTSELIESLESAGNVVTEDDSPEVVTSETDEDDDDDDIRTEVEEAE